MSTRRTAKSRNTKGFDSLPELRREVQRFCEGEFESRFGEPWQDSYRSSLRPREREPERIRVLNALRKALKAVVKYSTDGPDDLFRRQDLPFVRCFVVPALSVLPLPRVAPPKDPRSYLARCADGFSLGMHLRRVGGDLTRLYEIGRLPRLSNRDVAILSLLAGNHPRMGAARLTVENVVQLEIRAVRLARKRHRVKSIRDLETAGLELEFRRALESQRALIDQMLREQNERSVFAP